MRQPTRPRSPRETRSCSSARRRHRRGALLLPRAGGAHALAKAGYVKSRKGMHQGRRTTWIAVTVSDRKALRAHAAVLRELIASVD